MLTCFKCSFHCDMDVKLLHVYLILQLAPLVVMFLRSSIVKGSCHVTLVAWAKQCSEVCDSLLCFDILSCCKGLHNPLDKSLMEFLKKLWYKWTNSKHRKIKYRSIFFLKVPFERVHERKVKPPQVWAPRKMFYKHHQGHPNLKKDWNWNNGEILNHLNLLFSINVACVLDEVEVIWQIWKNVKICSMKKLC